LAFIEHAEGATATFARRRHRDRTIAFAQNLLDRLP
jgi:hypothetical protein